MRGVKEKSGYVLSKESKMEKARSSIYECQRQEM